MKGQYYNLLREKVIEGTTTKVPDYTRRVIHLPRIPNKAVAVVGMRRTGKSTFLWQQIDEGIRSGRSREGALYLSFEDERLAGLEAGELGVIVEEYYRLYPRWREDRRAAFFFDEIQLVEGWERFVRRILDSETADIFLSGSSAKLLSREIASSMRGRAVEAPVYPFSFREYLNHRGRDIAARPQAPSRIERSRLDHELLNYLEVGGFPEVQHLTPRDRLEVLKVYVDVVILRDIIERHRVTNPVALRWMVRHLLSNPCGMFTVHRLFRDLRAQGIAVAKDTLHAIFGHVQDAFLVHAVPVAARSERQRLVNPRKVYPIDSGLIPIFSGTGGLSWPTGKPERARNISIIADLGHKLETAVLMHFLRAGLEPAYVKTPGGYEVDFLVRNFDGRQALIQVAADLAAGEVREREVRALLEAGDLYPSARRLIITLTPEILIDLPAAIEVQRASGWLLSEDIF